MPKTDLDPVKPAVRRSEVTWEQGQGRQPYANQGEEETAPVDPSEVFPAGDRGEHSGVNDDQNRAASGKD